MYKKVLKTLKKSEQLELPIEQPKRKADDFVKLTSNDIDPSDFDASALSSNRIIATAALI